MRSLVAQIGLVLLLGLLPPEVQALTVQDVRMWTAPDHTRLVLDLDNQPEYKLFRLREPARVVVDIKGARSEASTKGLELPDPVVKQIRTGHPRPGTYRVVMDLKQDVQPKTFQLEPHGRYGHRLVIDLYHKQNQRRQAKKTLADTPSDQPLVAIDPGHGGEDPGAVGPRGTREKEVVLAIAKRVARELNNRPGMQAFLTREGDYFVGLRERVRKAREAGADLFVSIHADAFRDRDARGASVYTLSRQGATDEAAAWLARRENRSDFAGGVDLSKVDKVVASVLLDLSQTATISDSLELGEGVLNQLDEISPLHRQEVNQAPFVVLKSPDIPSILVEVGFISNPREEIRLRRPAHQRRLAQTLIQGVAEFLQDAKPRHHTVERGDTLWSIAQRYRVSVSQLRRLNDLQGSKLVPGLELRIP